MGKRGVQPVHDVESEPMDAKEHYTPFKGWGPAVDAENWLFPTSEHGGWSRIPDGMLPLIESNHRIGYELISRWGPFPDVTDCTMHIWHLQKPVILTNGLDLHYFAEVFFNGNGNHSFVVWLPRVPDLLRFLKEYGGLPASCNNSV